MSKNPLDAVRELAARFPEAEHTTILGDHEVFRVKSKVYLWLGSGEGGASIKVKLKDSQAVALMLPFVAPAGYGMAKWGWVDATFPEGPLPLSLVAQWLDESYRHTAPKKLVKLLDEARPAAASARAASPAVTSKAAPKVAKARTSTSTPKTPRSGKI